MPWHEAQVAPLLEQSQHFSLFSFLWWAFGACHFLLEVDILLVFKESLARSILNHIPERARMMIFDDYALAGLQVITSPEDVTRPSYKECIMPKLRREVSRQRFLVLLHSYCR